jgi:transcriptional regulator with PAS, ATPase and Fis domain
MEKFKMAECAWVKEFSGAVTICDADGVIVYMNDASAKMFEKYGGEKLLGSNILDCHPGASRIKLEKLMRNRETNVYTIEKKGCKTFIYQAPWFKDGVYAGFMELLLDMPFDPPHFVRG